MIYPNQLFPEPWTVKIKVRRKKVYFKERAHALNRTIRTQNNVVVA